VTTETAQLFFGLLTLAAGVGAIAYVVLRLVVASGNLGARRVGSAVGDASTWLAFLVAATSTLGSLYFSEIAEFTPCRLCWFQRIAMYPQVLLLGVAWYRRDEGIRHYVLPLSVIGALISTYHMLLERFPSLEGSSGCDPTNPCTIRWAEEFGFITISTMALSAFVLIALLMTHLPTASPDDATEPEHSEPTRTEVS
jgi:disulfide bond formation protein DsbB